MHDGYTGGSGRVSRTTQRESGTPTSQLERATVQRRIVLAHHTEILERVDGQRRQIERSRVAVNAKLERLGLR